MILTRQFPEYQEEMLISSINTRQSTQKKGTRKMAKKPMTKQTMALMKWREEHKDKDGKVIVARRSSVAILAELKKKREFYAERLAKIEKKIRYFDGRVNADKRKELVAQLTTEQLEQLVRLQTSRAMERK